MMSLFLERSLPDLNRSSRFCRPVPSPSAKRPFCFKSGCKSTNFFPIGKIFFVFLLWIIVYVCVMFLDKCIVLLVFSSFWSGFSSILGKEECLTAASDI